MNIEALEPDRAGRLRTVRSMEGHQQEPYLRHFEQVREAILDLLSARAYPLASRLFFIAYVADKVTPFFHRGAAPFEEERLREALDLRRQPELQAELHGRFVDLRVSGPRAMELIQDIVLARLEVSIPTFDALVLDGVSSYLPQEDGRLCEDRSVSITADSLWTGYRERRDRMMGTFGQRIDQMFANYCKNFWLREWYVLAPSLVLHTQALLVRLAVLRFLVFSHPRLAEIGGRETSEGRRKELACLESTIVEVFYKTLRAIEHDPAFLERVQRSFQTEPSLSHLVFLLKL